MVRVMAITFISFILLFMSMGKVTADTGPDNMLRPVASKARASQARGINEL